MPLYEYEVKTLKGDKIKGKLEGADETSIRNILRQQGQYPTKIRPYTEAYNIEEIFVKGVTLKDIAIFARQFSFILSAGISILRSLEIVKDQTESKKLRKILDKVFDSVQKGQTLSESMREFKELPDMLVNMVEVGETSGTLDTIMERMAIYYDKEYRQQQKVKQALTYPAVISIFALVVVIVLVVKVIPTFTGMLTQTPGAVLPLPTRIVLGISNFIQTKWWLLIAIIALIIAASKLYLKSEGGAFALDKFKLSVPIFGKLYSKVITARFARTFGTLAGSGVPLIQSIIICSDVVGNIVFRNAIRYSREELEKGESLGEILEKKNLFPSMLTKMIKIGEESGTLDTILEKTAEFYDGEVETATAQLTTLLEPVIIVVLGAVVGFIVLSIILPIFELYNTIGAQ